MNTSLRAACASLGSLLLLAAQAWAAEPEDVVRAHFLSINAEDYSAADQYFSSAFRRAFKSDFAAIDHYYIARRQQLASGYQITEVQQLADADKQTARVTVEFNDPDPESLVLVTERLHYYLLREKDEAGSPQRDSDGMAWRIDIFDALAYDTLAEARRRPYLYTREAWSEDESRELKAQQGLFRVQQALESFKRITGQYPLRLLGASNRRDELITGKFLMENYPACGFDDRPMEHVEFGIRSSGDFSYYSYDSDGDSKLDAYWLLLHGKVTGHALFAGNDCVMLLAQNYAADQPQLARGFAQWWESLRGESVGPGPALGEDWGGARLPAAPLAPTADAPENAALDAPPVVLDSPAEVQELIAPTLPPAPEKPPTETDAAATTAVPETPESAAGVLPVPAEVLIVHSWGFNDG